MTDALTNENRSLRFRKRPLEVDAWQYDGAYHLDDAPTWVREYTGEHVSPTGHRSRHRIKPDIGLFGDWLLMIPTLEGVMCAGKGDWVIRGVKGEVYPCKPDIFEATYERA